jgi:hypothetical protein
MRRTLLLLPFVLAACISQRDSCINTANKEMAVINNLVAVTRANVDRGYALTEKTVFVEVYKPCLDPEGQPTGSQCPTLEPVTQLVPTAIDLNLEFQKLKSLEQRQAEMQAAVNARIQQCIAVYPAE